MRKLLREATVPLIVLAALGVAALVFRSTLVAWFTGKGGGAWSAPARVTAGRLTIDTSLQPDPPRQEGDRVRVDIATTSGTPVDGAKVDVTYDMPAMGGMAEMKSTFVATASGPGRYEAPFDLPMGGSWGLIVTVTSASGSATARYSFTVGTSGLKVLDADSGDVIAPSGPPPPVLQRAELPPAALAALRGGFEPYDQVRSALGEGRVPPPATAQALAHAIHEALAAMPPDQAADVTASLGQSATAADAIASAADVAAARTAFAELNRQWSALAASDPRLADGWRTRVCPMAPGFGRWFQRDDAPANPYLGDKMSSCVTDFDGAAAASKTPSSAASGEIRIDEARRKVIGVRTGKVIQGPMALDLRAVGRLTYDETRLEDVTLKIGGFITHLRVAATGQAVKKGETLFTLYSPELYAAEQEYLLARQSQQAASTTGASTRSDALLRAAEKKLRLWGLSDKQLAQIVANGEAIEDLPFPSPASGYVIEKNVVEGASVETGARLFRIAALDKIWVEADVYERDLPRIHKGDAASVALSYEPGTDYDGKVTFVYPYLDPATRTGRVRIELPNKGLALKPDMYATVNFHVALGDRVQVPASAVVYTGPRRLVFVDLGDGRLRPQEVTIGAQTPEMAEVLSGLSPGDVVVTSGNFLVAAESRIRSSATYWEDSP
ncbi:MAG: efflux RND transporter periplasmic adaptor subunit [Myxococcales bacterium]|nr:efflux RND transporter periplasmic adaptor subunit [Myxococcales bacterium]